VDAVLPTADLKDHIAKISRFFIIFGLFLGLFIYLRLFWPKTAEIPK
jgi:hypothetical protein